MSLLLLQELSTPGVRRMVRAEGLRLAFASPQYGIAWDPQVWELVGEIEEPVLSATTYYTTGGHPMSSRAVRILLRHKPTGTTVDVLSYHTPPAVQCRPGHEGDDQREGQATESTPVRMDVLRESISTPADLAEQGRADAVIYGGDDNVDERGGSEWAFMLSASTGLRQVIAPEGTHGTQAIDDFRVRGLVPLQGRDVPTPSDHDAHVRVFQFPGGPDRDATG